MVTNIQLMFRDVALFPEATFEPPAPGNTTLELTVTNRGGGIGRVQVFLNDKELAADARGPGTDPNASQASLKYDLGGSVTLGLGEENRIRVVTWNAEGYLSSRGVEREWVPEGERSKEPPELFAIVGGVSEYASPSLKLRFAAKDARDMAHAIRLGGRKLFGAERAHVTLLASDEAEASPPEPKDDIRALPPMKDNFRKAFEDVRRSRRQDILVVYLSGHGTGLTVEGRSTYCYLTGEARSAEADVLVDPAVRKGVSITDEELVEWIRAIPATKQVMVLDTCAAGAVAAKLAEVRPVPGDQIRAIDRMKDRTGFHVLMGCASDRVSYEASRYAQGILTHSLLLGMKGAALREEKYVDVSKLFQYAADEVPRLVQGIGGIQKPEISAPRGGVSFDIGLLDMTDRTEIGVPGSRPLILRPMLMNLEEVGDSLQLTEKLSQRLLAMGTTSRSGSREPPLVYVDASGLPGAIEPKGSYAVEGTAVRVTLKLWRDGKDVKTVPVVGSTQDLAALLDALANAIIQGSEAVDQGKSEPKAGDH